MVGQAMSSNFHQSATESYFCSLSSSPNKQQQLLLPDHCAQDFLQLFLWQRTLFDFI
jgi:hypothetical protein